LTEIVVRIDGLPEADLNQLIRILRAHSADQYQVVPRHDTEEGVHEEPVTIAVALIAGSATAVKAIAGAISRWKAEREKSDREALKHLERGMKITFESDGHRRSVALSDISPDEM
jgi:hypothetical protein